MYIQNSLSPMPKWYPGWNPEESLKGVAGSPLFDARRSWNPYPVDGAVIIIEESFRHRVSPLLKRKQSYETRVGDQVFLEFGFLQNSWILYK